MKVLHLISGGDSGGAKTALFSLLSADCDELRFRVACLTDGVFYKELDTIGADKVLFRQKSRFDLSVADKIADMLERDGFDLLHAHGARANFIAALIKNRISVPVVTTVHSDYLRDFDDPVKKLVFTPLNVISLRKIKHHIAVSDSFRCMLIGRRFRPDTVYTVHNGLDASRVKKCRDSSLFFKSHGTPQPPCGGNGTAVFGCAARLDRVKGVDILLRAIPRVLAVLPSARFLIAGDGGERSRLIALARRLNISENVHFLGHISDISSFYSTLDAIVIPSRSESFPYSMLESAAHSVPVIAAEVGGIPEFVVHEKTGLLFPCGDSDSLAECMIRFARLSPDEKAALGRAASRRLNENFSAERVAHEHAKIYKRILSREAAHRADKKDFDFVISGYYGYENIGDEAVLGSIIDAVREKKPDAAFTVLSRRPKQTRTAFGVDACFRYGASVTSALKKSRVLLSGGGTLMQDKTSARSLHYYLYVIKKARSRGLAVMQYANGFGPIENSRELADTVQTINECVDVATARDTDTLRELGRVGVNVRALHSADPTLYQTVASVPSDSRRGDGFIAVSIRRVDGCETLSDVIVAAVKELCERRCMRAVFVVMHQGEDVGISKKCASRLGCEVVCPASVAEARDIFARASLVMATRLHAAVFAVCAQTPVVAVSYDKKVEGFMRHAGLDSFVPSDGLTVCRLIDAAERALTCGASPKLSELSELASVSRDEALRLLQKTKSEIP